MVVKSTCWCGAWHKGLHFGPVIFNTTFDGWMDGCGNTGSQRSRFGECYQSGEQTHLPYLLSHFSYLHYTHLILGKVSLILGVREIQKDLKKNTLMQLKKKNLKYIQPLFMKIFSVVLFTMMKKLETI